MQNLVLVLIALLMGVLVTASSVFFGGDSMTEGVISAEANRYRNEAIQISGAVVLFKASGNEVADGFSLQDLVDEGYLKTLPEGWEPDSDSIIRELDSDDLASEDICFEANRQSGFLFSSSEEDVKAYSVDVEYGIPYCEKEDLDNQVSCCIG